MQKNIIGGLPPLFLHTKMIVFDGTAHRVLSANQLALKPLLEEFFHTHFLVGGTAIVLRLGHRKSIDFDLFAELKSSSLSELKKREVNWKKAVLLFIFPKKKSRR